MHAATTHELPGKDLDVAKMPGHWLLARLGKRVLRPGGLALTESMLEALDIGGDDDVVELAPGLGITAALALSKGPSTYTGVDRDPDAAKHVSASLDGSHARCLVGTAAATGLADGHASVVYGEAMLTMQTPSEKRRIVQEAARVLRPGGRYAIHELGLAPDHMPAELKEEIGSALSKAIRVGARPLTESEWRELLSEEGFVVEAVSTAPMRLLEPTRVVRDEGLFGALRIMRNVIRDGAARKRVLNMRSVFQRYAQHMTGIALVARLPVENVPAC